VKMPAEHADGEGTQKYAKLCAPVGFGIVAFSRRPVKGASAASGGGRFVRTRGAASGSKSKNM